MTRTIIFLLFILPLTSSAQVKTLSGKAISTSAFESQIRRKMDSLNVKGMSVAIIHGGRVVYNQGFGYANVKNKIKVTPETTFEAASLSKPVFANYVISLAHKGLIDLERPLYQYLPAEDIKDERYKKITARMVLSHTTGLPNWRESAKMKLAFEPGTQFSYSGEAFMYLAKVVAHISKTTLKHLDQQFQKDVAIPGKLKNFSFIITPEVKKTLATGYQGDSVVFDDRDRSIFDPAGGLYTDSKSFGKFLTQLLRQKSSYKEMFRSRIALKPDDQIRSYFGINAWTLGLAVIPTNESTGYWHGGNNLGFTSSFMLDPERKFGYVFFTNADQCNGMKKVFEEMLWN